MVRNIWSLIITHLKNNTNTYFALMIAFIIGISAGAFTVNGLSSNQKDELSNYFSGFLNLLENHKVEGAQMLKASIVENAKIIGTIWVLGLTIIGIPFIFILVGIRGFITGFSSGFIIQSVGIKGAVFTVFGILPKELIIVPCIIALGVNGINFSMNIIKSKSIKHLSKNSLKTNFISYCFVTLFYTCFLLGGTMIEAYVSPVLIRIITPFIIK